MRIAGITRESFVDGPGVRFVVFAQGCVHQCPGCHNQETWNPALGEEWSVRELFKIIRRSPERVRGLTLSGGEPFLQAGQMADLASLSRRQRGLHIMTYTGYVYQDLLDMAAVDPDVARLLAETDVLVDGPFVEVLKDIGLRFRGSVNQRVIDMEASRREGMAMPLAEESFTLFAD